MFHEADEKVSGYGEVVAIIKKAKEIVDLFKKEQHKCTINVINENAEKTVEVITKKYEEYTTKNKNVWKEIVPIKFTDPESMNQPLEIEFNEVMNN